MAMIGALPPVGRPIVSRRGAIPTPSAPWGAAPWLAAGPCARFYASGTAALAAAIAAAVAEGDGPREVLLPAYGCPALVAATLWAGGTPTLVDLEPDSVRMDPGALEERLRARTAAAVVATHFLGFSERVATLATLCHRHGVRLIEDSAQAVPRASHASAADATVYSFGRGKPVSVMGGGAAVVRRNKLLDRLPWPEAPPRRAARGWRTRLEVAGYNIAIRPLPFRLLSSAPGSRIGATRYQPLERLEPADPERLAWLQAKFEPDVEASGRAGRDLSAALAASPDAPVIDLAKRMDMPADRECLLRYPLLTRDRETRERALKSLRRAGLGGSSMYGAAMPNVPHIPEPVCSAGRFVHAETLADRLLTLPTHPGVGARHVEAMVGILRQSG
jgi:dTDP-4-amino-4,6-dideoxygalactose transaminase